MNRKIDFKILENADRRTTEKLSNVPVLSKEEKERIYMKSLKKLNSMTAEKNDEYTENQRKNNVDKEFSDNFNTDTKSSAKEIKLNRYKPIISAAACIIAVVGISGTLLFMHNKNIDKNMMDSSTSDSFVSEAAADSSVSEISKDSENTDSEIEAQTTSVSDNESSVEVSEHIEIPDSESPVVTNKTEPDESVADSKSDDNSGSQSKNSEYLDISNNLIKDLNTLYFMGIGGGVSYDLSHEPYYVYDPHIPFGEEGEVRYDYVSDENYRSTEDIRNFINNTVTEKYTGDSAHTWVNSILDPACPMFVDYNGSLYGLKYLAEHSGGRGYVGYTATEIKDVTDTSFIAYVTADPSADPDDHYEMKVVKENGTWKVDEEINREDIKN